MYVNGKLHAEARCGFPRAPLPSPLVMVPADDQGRRFRDVIDEFRICGRSLYTGSEFSPADPLKEDPSDILMFHFDTTDSTVLRDSSSGGHHGHIVDAKRTDFD